MQEMPPRLAQDMPVGSTSAPPPAARAVAPSRRGVRSVRAVAGPMLLLREMLVNTLGRAVVRGVRRPLLGCLQGLGWVGPGW